MSKTRMTCKSYCELWNSWDRDCEAYGENHRRPRNCPIFLLRHPEFFENELISQKKKRSKNARHS